MKKMLLTLIAVIAMSTLGSLSVEAAFVMEVEPNDTFETAMDLDPFFTQGSNVNIFEADNNFWWTSVLATGAGGPEDFFTFTVGAGSTVYFDIDNGIGSSGSVDTIMAVWNAETGALLNWQDDNFTIDSGSVSGLDPWFQMSFIDEIKLTVSVSEFPSGFGDNGEMTGNLLDPSDTYTLNVSFDNLAPVPVPASMMLLGMGLLGLTGVRRKKS